MLYRIKKVISRRQKRIACNFRSAVLKKKAAEALLAYFERRQHINQLKDVGQELWQIKQTQFLHKSLVCWYDLMVRKLKEIEIERQYEIIRRFKSEQTR